MKIVILIGMSKEMQEGIRITAFMNQMKVYANNFTKKFT